MRGILYGKSLIRDKLVYEVDCTFTLKYFNKNMYSFKNENTEEK